MTGSEEITAEPRTATLILQVLPMGGQESNLGPPNAAEYQPKPPQFGNS